MASPTTRRCIDPALAANAILHTLSAETAFELTLEINPGELKKGSKINFGCSTICVDENSTNTHRTRLYLGTAEDATGILLGDTGALDTADGDVGAITGWGQVRTPGGAGVGILTGMSLAVPKTAGTIVATTFGAVEAQLDFTAKMYLTVTMTHSASHADNESRLESLWLEILPMTH